MSEGKNPFYILQASDRKTCGSFRPIEYFHRRAATVKWSHKTRKKKSLPPCGYRLLLSPRGTSVDILIPGSNKKKKRKNSQKSWLPLIGTTNSLFVKASWRVHCLHPTPRRFILRPWTRWLRSPLGAPVVSRQRGAAVSYQCFRYTFPDSWWSYYRMFSRTWAPMSAHFHLSFRIVLESFLRRNEHFFSFAII